MFLLFKTVKENHNLVESCVVQLNPFENFLENFVSRFLLLKNAGLDLESCAFFILAAYYQLMVAVTVAVDRG